MSRSLNARHGSSRNLFPALPRSERAELLDETRHDPAELADNFRDIQRVNRLLGGTAVILRHLPRLIDATRSRPVTILDLATGAADIPLAISRWARRRGLPVSIVASDSSAEILKLARARVGANPDITLARYDARSVPHPDDHFDIVLCSLSLHHFSPSDAIRVFGEMDRLARTGFILNDLRRGRLGFAAAWAASRLTTRNRLTRHDAPLSVLRAYTPDELGDLLRQAEIEGVTVTRHPWFRMAAVKGGAEHA